MHYIKVLAAVAALVGTAVGINVPDENAGHLMASLIIEDAMGRNYANVSYSETVIPDTSFKIYGSPTTQTLSSIATKIFPNDEVHLVTDTSAVMWTVPTKTETYTGHATLTIFGEYGSMDKVKKGAAGGRNRPHWILSLMAALVFICLSIPGAAAITTSASPATSSSSEAAHMSEATTATTTTAQSIPNELIDPDEVRRITHFVSSGTTTTTVYEAVATEKRTTSAGTPLWKASDVRVQVGVAIVVVLAVGFIGL